MNKKLVVVCAALGLAVSAAVLAGPLAVGRAQGETCTMQGDKIASPTRLKLGESVQIKLTVKPNCPPTESRVADIVLSIDRSFSMRDDGKLDAAIKAANEFVDQTDLTRHRIAYVPFHGTATVDVPLSTDKKVLKDHITNTALNSGTNISEALDDATDLLQNSGRTDALKVIILLTDGAPNLPASNPEQAAVRSANSAKLAGIEIFTIALGRDAADALLQQLATSPNHFYSSPSNTELVAIYKQIAKVVGDYALREMTLDDDLAANLQLSATTVNPTATLKGRRLTWIEPLVPASGLTFQYQITPTKVGTYPTNDKAIATFKDLNGVVRQYTFPVPQIEVLEAEGKPKTCSAANTWQIAIHSFPDTVGKGVGSYPGPGCNGFFDSADMTAGRRYPLPQLEYELTTLDGSERLFRGKGLAGPGKVDQRLYILTCTPPPYKLRLLTQDLGEYNLCSNSPRERTIQIRDFRPKNFKYNESRFSFTR